MRLMIVDDDEQIRNGIRTGIDWSALGIDEVISASSGTEALSVFHERNPEIVITDIRMPGINGLELLENIKASRPKTRVIILSGYTDFDYLKTAIKYDAVDYEVKPVRTKYLINLIQKIRDEILREQISEREYQAYLAHYLLSFEDDFITGKIQDRLVIREILNRCYSVSPSGLTFCVLFRLRQPEKHDQAEQQFFRDFIRQQFRVNDSQSRSLGLESKAGEMAFLIWLESRSMLQACQAIGELVNQIQQWVNHLSVDGRLTFTAGISGIIQDNDYARALAGAKQALTARFYTAKNSVLVFDPGKNLSSEALTRLLTDNDFRSALTSNDLEKADRLIRDDFSKIRNRSENTPDCIRQYAIELMKLIEITCASENMKIIQTIQPKTRIINQNNADLTVEDCQDLLHSVVDEIRMIRHNDYSPTISRATDYIRRNFTSDLRVESVAVHVAKSPNYFSHLFKTECGVSFKRYINKLRIEKAKTLLLETNMLISEISADVGFKDFTYFTQVFKKIEGYPPSFLRSPREQSSNHS